MSVQDKCSELPITRKMLENVEKKIERFHLDDSWTINSFSITGISYGVCYNVLVWELSDTTLYSMHLCLECSQDILCDQLATTMPLYEFLELLSAGVWKGGWSQEILINSRLGWGRCKQQASMWNIRWTSSRVYWNLLLFI